MPLNYLFSNPVGFVQELLIILPALLIALTFHEYAHGKVADLLGDDTPYNQGRLTLNPLPHLDGVGFIMFALAGFGWAKPVRVNPVNFNRNISMKRGMMLVALAGPAMNLLLAFIGMILLRIVSPYALTDWGVIAVDLINPLILYNVILAVFNLLPVPPLDGSKILAGLIPDSGGRLIYTLERYGFVILLVLVFTGIAGDIFRPIANGILGIMYTIIF